MSLSSVISTILLLTIVGAIIGGATNHIAIKMLFKPYYPIMIGKWRVPFTPGLIPKRHDEIARELGRLVMKHLITPDRLKMKLLENEFSTQISEAVRLQVTGWLESDATIGQQTEKWVDTDRVVLSIEKRLAITVEGMLNEFFVSKENMKLGEALPQEWGDLVEGNIPEFARYIAVSLSHYLESEEGKLVVTSQLDQFFEGKGFLGNMLGLFLGNQSIVDKLYPELISFLSRPAFIDTIEKLLIKEWHQWMDKSFGDVMLKSNLQLTGKAFVTEYILKHFSIRCGLNFKPKDILQEWQQDIMMLIPKATDKFLERMADKIPEILRSLDLESLVTEQVREFSIQELEDVVLIISKKEFKMITYLGALLGGLIGIIQAFVVIWMG